MSLQSKPKHRLRAAVAAVEFAVILPPVMLLILGALDVARVFALQHKLQDASMYGCRIYSLGDKTQQEAVDAVNQSMAENGLTGYTITFDPPLKSDIQNDLDPVTVTLRMPYVSLGLGLQSFFGGSDIIAQSVLPADLIGLAAAVGDSSEPAISSGTSPPPTKGKKLKKPKEPKKPKVKK